MPPTYCPTVNAPVLVQPGTPEIVSDVFARPGPSSAPGFTIRFRSHTCAEAETHVSTTTMSSNEYKRSMIPPSLREARILQNSDLFFSYFSLLAIKESTNTVGCGLFRHVAAVRQGTPIVTLLSADGPGQRNGDHPVA